MLHADHLHKSYGGRRVVDGMTLRIAPGEILGLLGPNGAGKSTTVAMLCALAVPDEGRLLLDGTALDLHRDGDMRRLKARIGLVPQDLAIHEDLSARANLELFGALYGLQGRQRAARVQAALELVGLAERAGDRPQTFSGGMKRRLNIACALVHDPDILLFDEPTVGVDPQSRNAIFDNLLELRRRGKALLYTTHYMEEAERLCDRIVIMDRGRCLADDSLDGLLRRLPSRCSVEIGLDAVPAPPALDALRALPGVQQLEPLTDGVRMGLAGLEQAAGVIAALAAQGRTVQRLASAQASLEDVFLALTGRQLRD